MKTKKIHTCKWKINQIGGSYDERNFIVFKIVVGNSI
jgi:hypothetical protein